MKTTELQTGDIVLHAGNRCMIYDTSLNTKGICENGMVYLFKASDTVEYVPAGRDEQKAFIEGLNQDLEPVKRLRRELMV